MHSQKLRVVTVVAVSIIMAILRTVIVTLNLEKNAMDNDTYYLPEKAEITAFTVVSIVFVLALIFLGVAVGKKRLVQLERASGAVPAASLVLAFSLIGAALLYAVNFFGFEYEFVFFEFLLAVLTLLSAIKFLISGLNYNKKLKNVSSHAAATLIPILFCSVRILADFISSSAAPLASSGAYHIVGLVAVLLYFLCEGKSYIADTSATLFKSFGYLSIFFLLVYSLPNLFLHCFGTFCFDFSTAFSVVDFGLVVYIAARLSSARITKKAE